MVSAGGVAQNTTISSGGNAIVRGGRTTSTTVAGGGSLIVSGGGVASTTIINSGGSETIFAHGFGTTDTVSSGASLTVSAGGSATVDEIAGSETVMSGGTATADFVSSGGTLNVSAGGLAQGEGIAAGGLLTLWGQAFATTISASGTMIVSSAGFAETTFNNGLLIVASGGTESAASLFTASSETVLSGGTASGDAIDGGGVKDVLSGGTAAFDTITSGLLMLEGGSASFTRMFAGTLAISAGGQAQHTSVFSGLEIVSSGGSASFETVDSGGLLVVSAGGSASFDIINGGAETVTSGGRTAFETILAGGNQIVSSGGAASAATIGSGGAETVSSGGTTSATAISGGLLELESGSTAAGDVNFSSVTGGRLQIDGATMPTTTISGMVPDDAFDLADVPFDSSGSAVLSANNELKITESGITYTLNLDPGQNFAGDTFQLSLDSAGSGTLVTEVCFCRGTMIQTEKGEVPIEDLRVGEQVRTLSGDVKPIMWIGLGRDLVTRANKLARPIIIGAGALADGVPARDLYLTHGHALYFAKVHALIPVEHLVNHHSIRWDARARVVEYYHLELEDHDVVLANGAPAESYYDAKNRALFHNTRPGSQHGAAKATFAPVLTEGEIVEDLWARLFVRCGGRIVTDTTDNPDFHLVADGTRRDPVAVRADLFSFAFDRVPRRELLLRSRCGVPSLLGLSRADHRPLGVAIREIVVENAGIATRFAYDAPQLREGGCYPPENGFSWTDGEFALPPRFFTGLQAPLRLSVYAERLDIRYPVSPRVAAAFAA